MLRGLWAWGLCVLILLAAGARAEETKPAMLAGIFSNHMVLQRDVKLPVWGWGKPGQRYVASLAGINAEATADASGRWTAWLPPFPAGGPHELSVSGPEGKQTVSDVLVGDVWLCSGQSNMEWNVAGCVNGASEVAASTNPKLRQIKLPREPAVTPQKDCAGVWQVADPANTGGWTAVGYFFGRDLQKHLGVPVGLINTSWGGTRVEAWTSREVLATMPGMKDDLAKLDEVATKFEAVRSEYDAQKKVYDEALAKLEALENDEAHQKKYAAPDFDDKAWGEIKTPADWDSQGYKGVKGEAWYRKTVTIPAEWAGKDLEFSPGAADEVECSYFNGKLVGRTGSLKPFDVSKWNVQRSYKVPGELVKAGPAVLAVRVSNLYYEGGLRSNNDPKFMYLKLAGGDDSQSLSLAGNWKFGFAVQLPPAPNDPRSPNNASVLFNGMVNPLIPFPVKGAIWYQGESNAGGAYEYRLRFPAMIRDWRARWGTDFSFLWVQLANFRAPQKDPVSDEWAVLRESQEKTLALPNTGTALAIDIGEEKDIHPRNKQTGGARLALAARAVAYGEKEIVHSGPRYQSMKIESGTIRLTFSSLGGGLVAKDGPALKRFSIAGADRQFVWADARIEGDTVVVSAPQVKEPKAVRYAFETNPAGCNLYNKEGLPASPFRTDNWQVVTQPPQPDDGQ